MKKWYVILLLYGALTIGSVANTVSYFQGSNNFPSEKEANLVKQEEIEDISGLSNITDSLKDTSEKFESDVEKSRHRLLKNYYTFRIDDADRKLKSAQEKYEKLKKSKQGDSKKKDSNTVELNEVKSSEENTELADPKAGDWVYINVDRANVYLTVKKNKVFVVATKGMKFKVKGIVKGKPLAQIEFKDIKEPLYVSLSDIAVGEGFSPKEYKEGYFFDVVHKGKVTIPDWGTYWCSITIPSVGLTENVMYGDYQWQVDDYEVCSSMLFGIPGAGLSSLFLGHNYKALKVLPNVKVGDTIDIGTSYGVYKYKVIYSGYCITDGYQICDIDTGKNMLENRAEPSGAEIIQLYTCMNSNINPTPYRWFVKAELVSK